MRSNRPRLPGELSETERHWDYLCMTVIAIDTAVMGAVPLLVGVAAGNDPPRGLAAAIGTATHRSCGSILPSGRQCRCRLCNSIYSAQTGNPGGDVWDAGQAEEPAE